MKSIKILKLKRGKERAVLHKHPWIFTGAVDRMPEAEEGDIVRVADALGTTLGYGFFSGRGMIVCRLFHFGETDRDFSADFWKEKIANALYIRERLVKSAYTDAFRILHAEGDFFPGIIADAYGDTVVVQTTVEGAHRLTADAVEGFLQAGFKYIGIIKKKYSDKSNDDEGIKWYPARPELPVRILENGLQFLVHPEEGQKTGFYLDQRENRQLLRTLAADKSVLNTFSYSGGFSVYALAGGASEVTSVDVSAPAVKLGDENVDLNGFSDRHASVTDDCFDFLRKTDKQYDIIVLDPPAFAKSIRSVPNAARGYKDLNMSAFKKLKPGGLLLTFSCSQNISRELFQKIVFGAAVDAGRNVRILKHLVQPPDHPVNIFHPEGEYLKGLLLHVE